MTEAFAPYAPTLFVLAGWGLLLLVLTALSVVGKPRARSDSGHPVRDYDDPFYRRHRAQRNAVEIAGAFVAVALACVLAGASPFWTNLLAGVFLGARVVMVAVHVGTTNQPLRSAFWALGTVCVLALGVMGLIAAAT